jgi:hypothetical protein
MTIELNCQECDAAFELEFGDLMEGEPLVCPECGQRAPATVTEELANALDDLLARVSDLRSRFHLALTVESDDLPAPYDEESTDDEEEDEDDEDEDESYDEDEEEEEEDYEDD